MYAFRWNSGTREKAGQALLPTVNWITSVAHILMFRIPTLRLLVLNHISG
jgi:hypothetical protein